MLGVNESTQWGMLALSSSESEESSPMRKTTLKKNLTSNPPSFTEHNPSNHIKSESRVLASSQQNQSRKFPQPPTTEKQVHDTEQLLHHRAQTCIEETAKCHQELMKMLADGIVEMRRYKAKQTQQPFQTP